MPEEHIDDSCIFPPLFLWLLAFPFISLVTEGLLNYCCVDYYHANRQLMMAAHHYFPSLDAEHANNLVYVSVHSETQNEKNENNQLHSFPLLSLSEETGTAPPPISSLFLPEEDSTLAICRSVLDEIITLLQQQQQVKESSFLTLSYTEAEDQPGLDPPSFLEGSSPSVYRAGRTAVTANPSPSLLSSPHALDVKDSDSNPLFLTPSLLLCDEELSAPTDTYPPLPPLLSTQTPPSYLPEETMEASSSPLSLLYDVHSSLKDRLTRVKQSLPPDDCFWRMDPSDDFCPIEQQNRDLPRDTFPSSFYSPLPPTTPYGFNSIEPYDFSTPPRLFAFPFGSTSSKRYRSGFSPEVDLPFSLSSPYSIPAPSMTFYEHNRSPEERTKLSSMNMNQSIKKQTPEHLHCRRVLPLSESQEEWKKDPSGPSEGKRKRGRPRKDRFIATIIQNPIVEENDDATSIEILNRAQGVGERKEPPVLRKGEEERSTPLLTHNDLLLFSEDIREKRLISFHSLSQSLLHQYLSKTASYGIGSSFL